MCGSRDDWMIGQSVPAEPASLQERFAHFLIRVRTTYYYLNKVKLVYLSSSAVVTVAMTARIATHEL